MDPFCFFLSYGTFEWGHSISFPVSWTAKSRAILAKCGKRVCLPANTLQNHTALFLLPDKYPVHFWVQNLHRPPTNNNLCIVFGHAICLEFIKTIFDGKLCCFCRCLWLDLEFSCSQLNTVAIVYILLSILEQYIVKFAITLSMAYLYQQFP
jgi:hypothetical protein